MAPEEQAGRLMTRAGLTLAVAESLTGGMICRLITDVPGSSAYFLEGHVTYSNQSKIRCLKVAKKLIHDFGAVSSQVAAAMAGGVRRISGADIGLATTGIAGPSGGTPDKPTGLVFIALEGPNRSLQRRLQLTGNRGEIREQTAQSALDLLLKYLEESPGNGTN